MSKLLTLAAIAGLAQAACAQSVWSNAFGGAWGIPANWTPVAVPNSATTDVLFPLAAITNTSISPTVRNLNLSNPLAQLEVAGGSSLTVRGTVSNVGTIVVNPTAGQVRTSLLLAGGSSLQGIGMLVLNANPADLDTAFINSSSPGSLTNGSTHIITGAGRMYMSLVNQGVIVADGSGNTLDFPSPVVNNYLIHTLNNAVVSLHAPVTQSDGAVLRSESGGAIQLFSTSYTGGTIEAFSGTVQPVPGSTATLNINSYSGVLNISNNSGVNIASTSYLHNGTVNINPTSGPDNAFMLFQGGGVLRGTGCTIALNANPANLDSAYIDTAGTMTLDATARIIGRGRIYGTWINNGLIESSGAGKFLDFAGPITNNALIRAVNGASIQLGSSVSQFGTATMQAAGGDLYFYSVNYSGGQIVASGGGHLNIVPGTTPRFDTQSITGDLPIPDNSGLRIGGSVNLNGTITVNTSAGPDATSVYFEQSALLNGANIVLNANPGNLDSAFVNNLGLLTLPAGNSITGCGRLYAALQNNGFVGVSGAGKVMDIVGFFTNSAMMRSDSGGAFALRTSLLQNGGGQLIADAGPLYLYGQTYTGGTFSATNGGSMEVVAGSTTILSNVTTAGPINIANSSVVRIGNANWHHDGVITVNTAAGPNVSTLAFNVPGTYSGNNTIVLNANPANLDTASVQAAGGTVTIPSTSAIRGVGRFNGSWVNQGQISTAGSGNSLEFSNGSFDNRSTVVATNGASLVLRTPWTQSAGASVEGQDSTIYLYATTYSGGRFATSGAGEIYIAAGGTLNGVRIDSNIREPANTTLTFAGGSLTHNGDLLVNATAALNTTLVNFTGPTIVNGTGSWRLNANSANFDTAYINATSGTIQFNKGLVGHGRVYCPIILGGLVSPDSAASPIGLFEFASSVTLAPTSTYEVQVGAGGTRDLLSAFGRPVTVQGDLSLSLAPGYVPAFNDQFVIISAATVNGSFAHTSFPALPNPNWKWIVRLNVGTVGVMVGCIADFNSDGRIDFFDYLDFVDLFSAGDQRADFNSDGVIDFFDYLDFVDAFSRAC